MNTLQAKFKVLVGDTEHQGHLSMNAFRILSQKFGIKLQDLDKYMSDDPLTALPALAYCGILNEKMKTSEKFGMDFDQFCALTLEDEQSMSSLTEAITAAFGSSDTQNEGNG